LGEYTRSLNDDDEKVGTLTMAPLGDNYASPLSKNFEKLLSESVDEALSSLGESRKQEFYFQLEENFGIKKQDIPHKIDAFERAIEKMLGSKADVLENLIVSLLSERIGRISELDRFAGFEFTKRVRHIREQLYKDLICNMQSGLAVFHFGNLADLNSFRLVAANSTAEKMVGIENAVGKSITEICPELLSTDTQSILIDMIRTGRARNLGNIQRSKGQNHSAFFSVAAFPLSNDYIGLIFKGFAPSKYVEEVPQEGEQPKVDVEEEKLWRWERDSQGLQQDLQRRSRAQELWTWKEIGSKSHAWFFSTRGREYLELGDTSKAREFFRKAEEAYQTLDNVNEAFENASLRLKTYFLEDKIDLQGFFHATEEYLQKYKEYSMHELFIENLAHFCQWKGYQQSKEHRFDDAKESYSRAEEMFLTVRQEDRAIFNSSRLVLIYKSEGKKEEFTELAKNFLEKYREYSGNKHYKEILAHYLADEASESEEASATAELLSRAEKLFLEVGQRQLAFENACKFLDIYWSNISLENKMSVQKCLEITERFFDEYKDFSETDYCKRRLAKYYLVQARMLTSQLQNVLR